ncbi:hypothetical protein GUITHDRAFT_122908 [Guillardia theta CCMP2712]|uniref:Uncharacterized protein n=1 Tax=Guillardia theta (strain CCMP2712) TaxID=905079 RepID=L1I4W4_GUITC|nr:hypothetical protein GUITHDRAFT_122908 [Guillardia theta CCMP2712]EKX30885.1 hypothetical protein GUITHDRAFT_122908 [Guillardia theta CCMP2712]|eukprot:XP_005817865.1 hypothetical protein GUITHDRAFT_122908 [Guillardia theta CCMP2712]
MASRNGARQQPSQDEDEESAGKRLEDVERDFEALTLDNVLQRIQALEKENQRQKEQYALEKEQSDKRIQALEKENQALRASQEKTDIVNKMRLGVFDDLSSGSVDLPSAPAVLGKITCVAFQECALERLSDRCVAVKASAYKDGKRGNPGPSNEKRFDLKGQAIGKNKSGHDQVSEAQVGEKSRLKEICEPMREDYLIPSIFPGDMEKLHQALEYIEILLKDVAAIQCGQELSLEELLQNAGISTKSAREKLRAEKMVKTFKGLESTTEEIVCFRLISSLDEGMDFDCEHCLRIAFGLEYDEEAKYEFRKQSGGITVFGRKVLWVWYKRIIQNDSRFGDLRCEYCSKGPVWWLR